MSRGKRFGVQPFNHVSILLFDDAALELERIGEFAAIEGEVAVKQGKALDSFILRQIGGQARYLALDKLVHPGMREQSRRARREGRCAPGGRSAWRWW